MPYISIQVTNTDVTHEQKAKLVHGVSQVLSDVLDKDPEKTFVVIQEIGGENWGVNGELVSGQ